VIKLLINQLSACDYLITSDESVYICYAADVWHSKYDVCFLNAQVSWKSNQLFGQGDMFVSVFQAILIIAL
jgi:hypothetical protein